MLVGEKVTVKLVEPPPFTVALATCVMMNSLAFAPPILNAPTDKISWPVFSTVKVMAEEFVPEI